jgi:hypothetical protein
VDISISVADGHRHASAISRPSAMTAVIFFISVKDRFGPAQQATLSWCRTAKIRHLHAESGRQIDLIILLVDQDSTNLLSHCELA